MVNKKIIGICFGILFLIVLIYYLGFYGVSFNKISGRAVLDLTANYQEGNLVEGALTLSLKEGELIPASSKILFITSAQTYEYNLTEFVADDLIESEGNFYLEGQVLSGSGLGYGVLGENTIYPKVDFTLNIYSPKTKESSNQQEEIPEEVELEIEEELEQSETEVVKSEEESEESTDEVQEQEGAPITGGVIQNFFKIISNFFLGITPTGQVSLKFEKEITGEVSQNEPFVYVLEEGQTVEIISYSQDIELNIQDNEVIITTDYSETEQGFGEDYLKDITKEIVIDLSSLGLTIEEGDLEISLVYEGKEIVSLITASKEEEILQILPEIEEEIANVLSDVDKEILFEKFGNSTVKITKAESVGENIFIRYELGEYWFEPSYDSSMGDDLNSQIEEDRIRWLQDIANTLLQEEIVSKELAISREEIKIF
jgi:hypothetical protein